MFNDPNATTILKTFRLMTPASDEKHRKVLTEQFGISDSLTSELYAAHDKCRRQLARVELKIYYSLISRMERKMRAIPVERRRYQSTELMSWQNYIRYVEKLEQLLQVRSPRTEKFLHAKEAWMKSKSPRW